MKRIKQICFPQLDMPKEQILANLRTVLLDACSHYPADKGTCTKGSHYQFNIVQT